MSYTEQIREHFATDIPKPKNKRELLLFGILVNADVCDGRITAVFGSPYAAYVAKDLCKLLRNLVAEISERPFGKRTEYTFVCENEKLTSFIAASDNGLEALIENAEDLKYYLRGAFLACGRITDPQAEAHVEFSFRSERNADRITELMVDSGLDVPGRSKRRDKFSVYYKSRDRISDLLTAMDSGSFVFDYINRAIYKSLEWNERRAINMISGNINRSIIAGERQAEACAYLLENKKGEHLTPELYATAILRVNNVNLSLAELAAVHNPPLTKSGLNNRLKKIIEIAEKNGFNDDNQ